jgi:hypothetical protein
MEYTKLRKITGRLVESGLKKENRRNILVSTYSQEC